MWNGKHWRERVKNCILLVLPLQVRLWVITRGFATQRQNKPTLDITHVPGTLLAQRQSRSKTDGRIDAYSWGIAVLDLSDIGASANIVDEKCARLVL